jgi:hypothetical protein
MTQSLGYHRLGDAQETREIRAKKMVFWGIYPFDKAISLRLGCMSVLSDSDISTSPLKRPEDPLAQPWHDIILYWIDLGRLQGKVFAELYTVAAISGDQGSRIRKASALALEINSCRLKWSSVSYSILL